MAHLSFGLSCHKRPRDREGRIVPRSRREQARGSRSGALAVRVRVPPADGQANRAVCRVLAEALEVPASAVRLIAGARSRHKRIRIEGPSQELAARISALGSAPEN